MISSTLPPVPRLDPPEWSDRVRGAWLERADRAAAIGRTAGTGRNFTALCDEARELLRSGAVREIGSRSAERRFVRAVVTVWLDDVELAESTMTSEVVRAVSAQARPSRLTTVSLGALFLTHFDRLDMWRPGLFVVLRDLVTRSVAVQAVGRRPDLVEVLRANADLVESGTGPVRLARRLVGEGSDAAAWFRQNHIYAYLDSRFGRLVRDSYYLELVGAADAENDGHRFLGPVTAEALARQKTEATDEDGLSFGHLVLTALTAKQTKHPSAQWLQAVLEIGGDPRLAETARWQLWWARTPELNRLRAVRWMQGANLRAFLDGVETYARETSNDSMLNMLERRKRLLIGLYEQDRVEGVRLILGDHIRQWINRSSEVRLGDVARLQDSSRQDTAVIYVDCGDFALVEGSHNFKLHIYIGGSLQALANPRKRQFSSTFLREDVPRWHSDTHGPENSAAIAHQGGEWIRKALDFLAEHDVVVDERALMTPADFADLGRRRQQQWW